MDWCWVEFKIRLLSSQIISRRRSKFSRSCLVVLFTSKTSLRLGRA